MILRTIFGITDHLTSLLTYMVRSVLVLSFLFSIAYAFGWVQRLVWFMAEQTASHIWNGTPVTIGSLEVDLIRGRVWATNIIIHTPKRDEWKWESPLICRIGRIYCEHNWISSFFSMVFRMACGYPQKQILEIYSLEVSDIQAFVERKQHIFNIYLMDRWWDLPDPNDILQAEKEESSKQQYVQATNEDQQHDASSEVSSTRYHHHPIALDNHSEASVGLNVDEDNVEAEYTTISTANASSIHLSEKSYGKGDLIETEDDAVVHRQAQQLVDEMFIAVKSIGRAARRKGSISMALQEQRTQLTSKLKALKGRKNKSEAMQEGVKVIQRVGQAVAKKSKDIQMLPKMPPRRKPTVPPLYARVGRIIVEDARIFTRTNTSIRPGGTFSTSTTSTAGRSTASMSTNHSTEAQNSSSGKSYNLGSIAKDSNAMSNNGLGAKWNKPIGISEIVLRPSELCPPSSLVDETGLPAIYQPLDKIIEVVWKRALVGMAKSNTSRFLQTALGEMLELEYLNLASEPNETAGDQQSDVGSNGGNNLSGGPQQDAQSTHPPEYRRSGTAPSVMSLSP